DLRNILGHYRRIPFGTDARAVRFSRQFLSPFKGTCAACFFKRQDTARAVLPADDDARDHYDLLCPYGRFEWHICQPADPFAGRGEGYGVAVSQHAVVLVLLCRERGHDRFVLCARRPFGGGLDGLCTVERAERS